MKKLSLLLVLFICIQSFLPVLAQNVGIGTTTPAFRLDVKTGSINTDSLYRINALPVLSIAGTQNVFIGVDAGLINNGGSNNVFAGYRSGVTNVTGSENSFFGSHSGWLNGEGSYNSFFGHFAGSNNSTGSNNSIFGRAAGTLNNGDFNSFFGTSSGIINGNGSNNAFYGFASGSGNTSGNSNSFFGGRAGSGNITAHSNVAMGFAALKLNTAIPNLVAIGDSALYNNGTGATGVFGTQNTAVGSKALYANTTGYGATAIGFESLYNNISGTGNTAIGYHALYQNTAGSTNVAIGHQALNNTTSDRNVAIGYLAGQSNVGGSYNTMLGTHTNVNTPGLVNSTAIGARATVNQSNSMVLGAINGTNGATSSTYVGIGLTNPGAALEVKTTIGFTARFGGNNGMYISLNENDIYRGYIGSYSGAAEDVDFGTGTGNSTGDLHLTIQAVPKLTIQANGNTDLAGELNTTATTGAANLIPVAYGKINSSGTIAHGTGNYTVNKLGTGYYEIVVSGLSLQPEVVTTVTPISGATARMATTTSGTGVNNIVVLTWTIAGTAVDAAFNFTVFRQ